MTLTSVIYNINFDLPSVNIFGINNIKNKNKIWPLYKIILYSITFFRHHQMWVSCTEYFPIHQMKPCQVDWQKLVFQEKIILFQRK